MFVCPIVVSILGGQYLGYCRSTFVEPSTELSCGTMFFLSVFSGRAYVLSGWFSVAKFTYHRGLSFGVIAVFSVGMVVVVIVD